MTDNATFCFGLLRRRQCLGLTWRARLALLLALALAGWVGLKFAHPFLAVNDPLPGGALVVEGWAPDYGLRAAIAEFNRRPYTKIYVTGGPLERGAPLSEYKTFAELGAATLVRMGMPADRVQPVPAPLVLKDRTYVSALAFKTFLLKEGVTNAQFNILTGGCHARRSRLMFQEAFGEGCTVGVLTYDNQEINPENWWKTSAGVRTVLGELIAYAYARLVFTPAQEEAERH